MSIISILETGIIALTLVVLIYLLRKCKREKNILTDLLTESIEETYESNKTLLYIQGRKGFYAQLSYHLFCRYYAMQNRRYKMKLRHLSLLEKYRLYIKTHSI